MSPEDKQLDVLLTEYKEMRTEIRSTYSLYFSILFGVIFTGIIGTFYLAIDKQYLFLTVPIMILAWFSIALIIRLNVQHLAAYIANIEQKINVIAKNKIMYYETGHSKLLWFSPWIKIAGSVPVVVMLVVYFLSIYKGFQFLSSPNLVLLDFKGINIRYGFVSIFSVGLLIMLFLFVVVPEKLFKREVRDMTRKTSVQDINPNESIQPTPESGAADG